MECICDTKDLFCYGCCCGYHRNQELKLYHNGRDYVIARNPYHASWFLREEGIEPTEKGWFKIDDDEQVTFSIGSPEGESLTAAEWVETLGEGYAVGIENG